MNLTAKIGLVTVDQLHAEVLGGEDVVGTTMNLYSMLMEDIVLIPLEETFPMIFASRVQSIS